MGRVRFIQARECATDWIAYFDADVYVYSQWWPAVSKYILDPSIAMVLGFADSEVGQLPDYDAFLKFRAKKYGAEAFSNTLVRRELVLECEEQLRNVHAGEDSVVAKHIKSRGYQILTIARRLCFHDRVAAETHPRVYFRSGQSIRRTDGIKGLYRIANSARTAIRDWWDYANLLCSFNVRLLIYLGSLYAWMLIGFLSDTSVLKSQRAIVKGAAR